ncbi:class I SAM-dependent methyltransferase [Actinoplanes sp. KI2]|uniref:class I SAM-dependent methyltransferase n=1 Tax=Actinoplanes sp. KI2 TaxID=2983315 RepID=UPI0021D5F087|nr:class I SAM-dependent methyltransferase [Actinoplanes sp. KI2]MCU7725142.1 class I SAM-dependent methyltransferase [Actinoplanes sp. KI2]
MTSWTVRSVASADARFVLFPSMGEYRAYDDHVYDAFDAADDRHRAYRDAVRAAAHGKVVVDVGTGRDALWALEAARAGARHVYAIEADARTAERADEAVASAGLGDRVTVLPGHSTEQTLPVRAEVCVSDIVGNIATAEGAIPILADAGRRLCTPDCVWIPYRMQTWAAAVDLSASDDLALAGESLPYLRAIFDSAGGPFDPRLCLAGPVDDVLISSCAPIESVTFSSGAPPQCDREEISLRIAAEATITGVLLWARVAASRRGGREVDCLTGDTRAWAPVYVPLPSPRPVVRGEHITLALDRTTSDDGVHPDYDLTLDGDRAWHAPHHGGAFRATPFYRRLFPPAEAPNG